MDSEAQIEAIEASVTTDLLVEINPFELAKTQPREEGMNNTLIRTE